VDEKSVHNSFKQSELAAFMRLLIYIHSLENGGAERVVANLANHWASAGWELTVVTVASQATDFYGLHPAIRRISLDLAGNRRNLASGFVRTARRVRSLRRVLQSVRPDVAISAMHTANVILSLAARGLPELCAIGSEHNFPPKAPMGIIWETMRRHAYAGLAAVVALTHECASWLSCNSYARCVKVIPNPVSWPLSEQEPRIATEAFCAADRRILLGVGRLSMEKNFSTLINTFARLAPRQPEWDLVIVGDGPLREDLQSQVRTLGLERRVSLPGRVGNMGDWYARADLYAMSSDFEGFPNTLVEAMAYGLPAVSFDCDTGPRDIIRHQVDGFLVAPGDEQGMESALGRLMEDDALRTAFSLRARQARERFSMTKIAGMWEDLFSHQSRLSPSSARVPARSCVSEGSGAPASQASENG
jgi:glycosyltransferase involved in cell wall biosynthesis